LTSNSCVEHDKSCGWQLVSDWLLATSPETVTDHDVDSLD
jgi:hypothetical protein